MRTKDRLGAVVAAACLLLACSSDAQHDSTDVTPVGDGIGIGGGDSSGWGRGPWDCLGGDAGWLPGKPVLLLTVTPPSSCGWYVGASTLVPVTAQVVDVDGPVEGSGITSLQLHFVDVEGDTELLLDAAENKGQATLAFDAAKLPGGIAQFVDAPAPVPLRVTAISDVPGEDGQPLTRSEVVVVTVDLIPPEVSILIPEAAPVIEPFVEKIPYKVEVVDEHSGFGAVQFQVGSFVPPVLLAKESVEGETTTLTGLLDATPLGVYNGTLRATVTDCAGNAAQAEVPLAVVSEPKFLQAPTISCDAVKEDLDTDKMVRLRAGYGDADDAHTDFLLSAGEGVYASWGQGDGVYSPLELLIPLIRARDARFVEVTGDGLPDVVVVHRNPDDAGENLFSLYVQVKVPGMGDERSFLLAESQVVGDAPFALEAADVTGDGFVDLLIGHQTAEDSVALVRHTGHTGNMTEPFFEPLVFLTGVADTSDMKLGDVNSDGMPDIVMTQGDEGVLSTYLNNGDGTFMMAHNTMLLGQDVPLVGLGDFNADAVIDALVFVRDKGAVYELDGKNNGYFVPTAQSCLGWSSNPAETVLSIVAGDRSQPFVPKAGKVGIVGGMTNSAVVADFNLDGFPDVALSESKAGIIQLFWGLGDGTFGESYFLNAWPRPYSLVAADLNEDPIPDMACLRKDSCEIVLFLSRDDGGCGQPGNGVTIECPLPSGTLERAGVPLWSTSAEIPAPVHIEWHKKGRLEPTHVLVEDFDRNLAPDMAILTMPALEQSEYCFVSGEGQAPVQCDDCDKLLGVVSYLAIGRPDLTVDMLKSTTGPDFQLGVTDAVVGDFNGDNRPDIAIGSATKNPALGCVNGEPALNVDILLGNHSISSVALNLNDMCGCIQEPCGCVAYPGAHPAPGEFTSTGGLPVPSRATAVGAARLDGDAVDDLVLAIERKPTSNCGVDDQVHVVPSRPSGAQCSPEELPQPPLSLCQFSMWFACPGVWEVCESSDEVFYPDIGQYPVATATGDINNDGIVDIVVANQETRDVSLFTGSIGANGEYLLRTDAHPLKLISLGEEPLDVGLGDVDGDGYLDLVSAFANKISMSWGVDGTNFETPFYIDELPDGDPIQPSRLLVSDFSGDGYDDVLVLSKKTSRIHLYVSLGQRKFAGPYQFTAATEPSDIQMADINQDGCTDLVVANEVSKTVSLLINEFCPTHE